MNKAAKLRSFRELLYPNNEEAEELNEVQVKKVIYEGLREILKLKEYQFTVGSYKFDITPRNLSVKYETPDTIIEVSNKDVHFETTRQTPIRYFVISDEPKFEYPDNQPVIQVSSEILQYDNFYNSETFTLELMSNDGNFIKKYLKVPAGWEVTEDTMLYNPKEIAIYHEVNKTDKRVDAGILFDSKEVRPAFYDLPKRRYIPTKFEADETYEKYLPNLDKKKKIVSTIYSTIIEFYNEYLNK
ncbi:MAG: hypothetical protein II625_02650 [Bacilli bacterium]|nr:hypothetical protein [Bacilli bacterium]